MSTIASLLSLIGQEQPRPWDIATRSQTQAETGLLELADLKAKQQAEKEYLLAIQNNPELAQRLFGDSTIGSLGTAPAAPPGGALTQQAFGPGGPSGPAQVVPGGQNLSRFATPEPQPQQSIIGSLGPAGQPPRQAPQNPALAMAAQNPRVAMMMQQQMEGRQEAQLKRQEQQLKMREATADAFASRLQGVNSQESYDVAVQELMQWAPEQASRLPKVWSKEAMEPIIASALSAKDKATLQIAELNEQTDLRVQRFKEQQASAGVPKYTEDSTLNVAIDRRMQQAGIPRGTPPPEAILTQAQQDVETGKIRVSASQGTGQVFDTPDGKRILRPGTNTAEPLYGPDGKPLRSPMTEGESKTAVYTSTMKTGNDTLTALEKSGDYATWKLPLTHLPGGHLALTDKQKEYETAKGVFLTGLLRYQSAGQITKEEWKEYGDLYFPVSGDSPDRVEFKRKNREAAIKTMSATLGRPLPGQDAGGQSGTQVQGSTSAGTSKPVAQMNADETRAEIAAIKARGGR